MVDRRAASNRFLSCYAGMRRKDLAALLQVHHVVITRWAKGANVPWNKLKFLSDSQGISWDWLLAGTEPMHSGKVPVNPESSHPPFDIPEINRRFVSLFTGMTQADIAQALEISLPTVNQWCHGVCRVPWKQLDFAVTHFGVRWDWLIDGIEPKHMEDKRQNSKHIS